jgi:hypothetical protein
MVPFFYYAGIGLKQSSLKIYRMKKLLFLILGAGLTMTTMAQTKVISKTPEKNEIKHDIKVKRAHKKEAFKNLAKLKIKKAGKEQDVVNAKRKEIHKDTKDLRAVGVKHPAHEAKKEIRKEKKGNS